MNEYIKRFAWWFLALATVAGLYLAAEKVGVGRWFLGVTLASGLLATVPVLTNWFVKARRYPQLISERDELQKVLTDQRAQARELEENLILEYERGVEEGKMQIIGSELAARCVKAPSIIAVSNENGSALLIGSVEEEAGLEIGARFDIQVLVTGERKGIVQVADIKAETRTATLVCVENTVPEFWEVLAQRAAADPSPPPGMHLVPYVPELPLEYMVPLISEQQPEQEFGGE